MNRILAILLSLVCAVGCEFIPLYELDGNVVIDIEYQLEQQVSVRKDFDPSSVAVFGEKVHGKMPEYVQVQFYRQGTHELVVDEYLPATGGLLNVPTDTYDILIYSLHSKVTEVQGTSLNGKNASSGITGVNSGIGDYRSVITEPDHLYCANVQNLEVAPVKDDLHEVTCVNAVASSVLETWTLEILNVTGIEYISECELYLTSQEGRAYLWGKRKGNLPGALRISAYPDIQGKRLYSVFNTFGRYEDFSRSVDVVLKVKNTAGNEYTFKFDVTDQVDDRGNEGHNIVIDREIVIPSDGGSGGFDPVVNPWWNPIIITN